MYFLVSVVIGN